MQRTSPRCASAPHRARRPSVARDAGDRHIQRAPATGSPRYAHELNLPGLRFCVCSRCPYLVFYMERADRIDVWRVLHAKRDMKPRELTVIDGVFLDSDTLKANLSLQCRDTGIKFTCL